MSRIRIENSLTDHLLVLVGGVTSVYSIGESLGRSTLAWTLAILVILSSMAGYGLSRLLKGTPFIKWDAGLWTALGLASFLGIGFLNPILPEGGFPFQILAAGMLSWMIILCSVVSWRDRTLLFLSLPSIALFGLVGTFDNYALGTWLFFAFLVCTGVLYARVHLRAMAERARLAGEEDPALLFRGAWKWMAGPEWAFASGFLIIALSLIGAPVIRQSVQQVAGTVPVRLPSSPQTPQLQAPSSTPTQTTIGRGPNNPSESPVFNVVMEQPWLLRASHLTLYTGQGWSQATVRTGAGNPWLESRSSNVEGSVRKGPHGGVMAWPGQGMPPAEMIASPQIVSFALDPLTYAGNRLLAPGPIVEAQTGSNPVAFYASGEVTVQNALSPRTTASYWCAIPRSRPDQNSEAVFDGDFADVYLDTTRIAPRVSALAQRLVRMDSSDYEKAVSLQQSIASMVKYNLNAAATPPGVDPVENFLFDSKEGYCDLFASSMVLMARAVGLPARYTTGWLVDQTSLTDKGYLVREKDYHAWAEIYFKGYGWVPFDATEGAEEVPGGERGAARSRMQRIWDSGIALPILGGIVAAGFLIPVVISLASLVRKRLDPAQRRRGELASAHAGFHMAIEGLTGAPKRFSQTLREYVVLHEASLGPLAAEAMGITEAFESAMFSPASLDHAGARQLSARVRAFRSSLGKLAAERRQAQKRKPQA